MNRFREAYYQYLDQKWGLIPIIVQTECAMLHMIDENLKRPTEAKRKRQNELVETYSELIKKYQLICFKLEWCDIQAIKTGKKEFIFKNCKKTIAA